MLYSYSGKAGNLLDNLQNFMGNTGNSTEVPRKTILENFGNSIKSLGATNIKIYENLEGELVLSYILNDKKYVVSILEVEKN